jgi:hypothetical protein
LPGLDLPVGKLSSVSGVLCQAQIHLGGIERQGIQKFVAFKSRYFGLHHGSQRICNKAYSPEPLQACTSGIKAGERWLDKLKTRCFLVAAQGNRLVGFASIQEQTKMVGPVAISNFSMEKVQDA